MSNKYPNVMLDIETMGNKPTSAIIEIGACVFDSKRGITKKFDSMISLETCIDAGLTMDASTVLWWMKQKWDARKRYVGNEMAPPIEIVLHRFREWMPEKALVWGNGSDFDNVILTNAYRAIGQVRPWPDYHDRCFRTLKNLYPRVKPPKREGVHHSALDDAIHQAKWFMKIFGKEITNELSEESPSITSML
jgi:exodeoxyribonuclease VIII